MVRLFQLTLAVMLVLAACSDTGSPTSATSSTATTAATAPAPVTATAPAPSTTTPTTGAPAESPVRGQLAWVLDALGGGEVAVADIEERFDAVFLAQLPAEQTVGFLAEVAAQGGGPVEVVAVLGETDTNGTYALAWPGGLELNLSLSVVADPPHRINGLFLVPAEMPELEDPPQTWDELSSQLGALAIDVGLLAAEIVDGDCVPIHATRADDVLSIASVFKLYVLGALADAIAAGDVGWDDPLAIRDDLKSLPSGTMQDEDAGSEFTVFEFAKLMISISDNTATDHLMDLLGRDAVEAAQAPLGHSDPAANVPFFTTRDLFVFALALDDQEVAAYLELDPAAARAYLDDEVAGRSLDDVDLGRLATPADPAVLGWFASPLDACRALVALLQRAGEPGLEQIRDVLDTPAAQLGVDGKPWDYFAFKGGSGPGVLALAVLGERDDGRTFVFAALLNDAEELIDEFNAVLYLAEAMRLLAETP